MWKVIDDVLGDQSSLVEALFEYNLIDIDNDVSQPGKVRDEFDLKQEFSCERIEWVANEDDLQDNYVDFADYLENGCREDVREYVWPDRWQLVTERLWRHLKDHDEVTIAAYDEYWWGVCSGDTSALDAIQAEMDAKWGG